jgi:hypothetical protein
LLFQIKHFRILSMSEFPSEEYKRTVYRSSRIGLGRGRLAVGFAVLASGAAITEAHIFSPVFAGMLKSKTTSAEFASVLAAHTEIQRNTLKQSGAHYTPTVLAGMAIVQAGAALRTSPTASDPTNQYPADGRLFGSRTRKSIDKPVQFVRPTIVDSASLSDQNAGEHDCWVGILSPEGNSVWASSDDITIYQNKGATQEFPALRQAIEARSIDKDGGVTFRRPESSEGVPALQAQPIADIKTTLNKLGAAGYQKVPLPPSLCA